MRPVWKKLLIATALLAATVSSAEDAATVFARVASDDDENPRALQMAIVTYLPASGSQRFSVDLISAIHIGDESYYAELNDRFRGYDALLYELVAPPNAAVSSPDGKRKGFISNAQLGMKNLLDLSFQLDEIDYDRGNFVHADLSPEELRESMAERDESLYVYFWRIFFATMDEYAKDPLGLRDLQMLSAMIASGEDNAFKTMLAYELADPNKMNDVLGEDSDNAVIGARNQRAIDVLGRQLDAGAERVGIFYGVAHMADMEDRLIDQLGLVYDDTTWVDAWTFGSD